MTTPVTITIDDGQQVSGLLLAPPDARACYVFAHGAGAGMAHPFMAAVATGLAERGIATLRYQFPYMERGSQAAGCAARSRTRPCARPSPKPRASCPGCRCSRAASPSAAA